VSEEQEGPESALLITFSGPGSAEFSSQGKNVTPAQMMAAGEWLRARAVWLFQQQWTAQAMAQAQEQAELAQLQQRIRGKVS